MKYILTEEEFKDRVGPDAKELKSKLDKVLNEVWRKHGFPSPRFIYEEHPKFKAFMLDLCEAIDSIIKEQPKT